MGVGTMIVPKSIAGVGDGQKVIWSDGNTRLASRFADVRIALSDGVKVTPDRRVTGPN